MTVDEIRQEIYQDIDHLTSVIFVVNIHQNSLHYTVTVQKALNEAPFQYAFRDHEPDIMKVFSEFRLDILALGFVQGSTLQNEYRNRQQVTFERVKLDQAAG